MKNSTGGLGFNGMDNGGTPGYNSKYQHNQTGKTAKANYGRGPTTAGTTGKTTGVATAKTGKINGGTSIPDCSMDINVGRGPTTVGGK